MDTLGFLASVARRLLGFATPVAAYGGLAIGIYNTVRAVRRERPRFRASYVRGRNFHIVSIQNAGVVPVVITGVELHRKGAEPTPIANDLEGHPVVFPKVVRDATPLKLRFPVWTKDDPRWESVRGVLVAGADGSHKFLRGIRYLG